MEKIVMVIEMKDGTTVVGYQGKGRKFTTHQGFLKFFEKLCKENNIPYGQNALGSYGAYAYSDQFVYSISADEFQEDFGNPNPFEDLILKVS